MNKRKQNLIKWGLYPSFGQFASFPSMLSVSHERSSALSDLPKTHEEAFAQAQANSKARKPEFEKGPTADEKVMLANKTTNLKSALLGKSDEFAELSSKMRDDDNASNFGSEISRTDSQDAFDEKAYGTPSSPTNIVTLLDDRTHFKIEDLADKTEHRSKHEEGHELWTNGPDRLFYEVWFYNKNSNNFIMIDGLNPPAVAKELRPYLGPKHLKQSIDRINVMFELNGNDGYTAAKVVKFKIVNEKRVPRYS